jgi:poly-beta-1,6-N-acetyl-D-glucosamine biosynthesis protein PgaD
MRPLILVVLWLAGAGVAYFHMIYLEGLDNLGRFWDYLLMILGIYTVMHSWSLYNALRFRGRERRKGTRLASDNAVGAPFGLRAGDLQDLQRSRTVEAVFGGGSGLVFQVPGKRAILARYDPLGQAGRPGNLPGTEPGAPGAGAQAAPLRVGTVGGYTRVILPRGSRPPAARDAVFTTSRNNQDSARIRIFRGVSNRAAECEFIGELELAGLLKAPRGAVRIEISLEVVSDALLRICAREPDTGLRADRIMRLAKRRHEARTGILRTESATCGSG